jgi:excisionase family DNA binding protein
MLQVKMMQIREKTDNLLSFMEKDVVMTTNEAMKYLKISKPTLLKYIHNRKIKATKIGTGWRILQSELYWFLKGGEEKKV